MEFSRVKEILSELPLAVQDEEYTDNTLYDYKYVLASNASRGSVLPVSASLKAPASLDGSAELTHQKNKPTSQSKDNQTKREPQPVVNNVPDKWHIETVFKAYKHEKLTLNSLNSDKALLLAEIDSALQRCRVLHELIGIDDVRLATRERAIEAAFLLKSLPTDPLKTKHKALFEGKGRQKWASINETLEEPLPTLAQRTANGYTGAASSIYQWAEKHYDKSIGNPWSGLIKKRKKGQKKEEQRLPMTESDLASVFSHKVFSQAKVGVNTRSKVPCPYQYWLPLLTLYCALRGNEGAQLYRDDIKEEFGVPYIEVHAERDDQFVKNDPSIRKVPIHSRLIELGFLDYVALFEPDERLFPELPLHQKDHYFRNAGDWFTRTFKATYEEHAEKKCFYSLRHNAVGYFKEQIGENHPIIKALVGHTNGSVTFDTYGKRVALQKLKEQVEQLHFPGVPDNITPFFEGNYLQYQKVHRQKYQAMKLRE
ncbi:hypothetical protein VCO01S_03600 [Vibrio comitans NBRC 102076]|uniref:Tyr recombinase domain-containing protein n=1 Tax=Vibrio comitans NBRC 102076 TaxID=1219078 RepID=A0A4Y3IIC4_9VIBR|nr:hypothetical protein VCO01S_03600 [Vibrio comitans NBRC 102076]